MPVPHLTLTIGELLKKKFPPGHHIIGGGLLNRGAILVVGGPPKSFKSIVVNSMLCQLATAEPLFGASRAVREQREHAFPIENGYPILYFEQEVGEEDLQERFGQYTKGLSKQAQILISERIRVHSCNTSLRFDTISGLAEIREILAETVPDVVCFDPLVEFHGADENSSHEMAKVLRGLDELRGEFGFSTILVHHTSKPGEAARKGPDRLRGSSILFGKVDSIMLLDRDPKQEGLVKASFTLRRGKPVDDCYLQINEETLRTRFVCWGHDPNLKDKRGRAVKPKAAAGANLGANLVEMPTK